MGNKPPKESSGVTCICGRDLPACNNWDDITEGYIKHSGDKRYVFTYLGGQYYRIKGDTLYYCPECFWRPKLGHGKKQKNFLSWSMNNEREEMENMRQRVYKSTTRPFGLDNVGVTGDAGDSTIPGKPGSSIMHLTGSPITKEITEYVVSVVPAIKPDEPVDIEWLKTVQTLMLCNYAQQNGFSLAEEQLLFYLFSCIQTNLNDRECLYLTKAVHKLCSSPGTEPPRGPPDFLDRSGMFMSVLLYCGVQLNYANTKWMQQCLNSLVSAKIQDKQLKNMIIEASSKFWSPYDSLCFLQKSSDKKLSDLDQKRLLHLTRTHDTRYPDVDKAMEAGQCSSIIQNLYAITKDEPLKSLQEVMKEIRDSKLVQPEILDKVEEIVNKVRETILDTQYFDITNPAMRSMYFSQDAFDRAELAFMSDNIPYVIATLACGIREHKGYTPRVTQLVALTILILSDKKSTSRLLEVMTGEGKSCIIAMFAAALAAQGKHVDIITSSPLLAYRDAVEWEGYYKMFGLKSTHNIMEMKKQSSAGDFDVDTERLKTYKHNIVYGTVSNFAADVLRKEFEQKPIRSDGDWYRRFDAVIADEVDLLMLDEGVQFTYLSHSASVLHHMEPVLASVWCVVGQYRPVNTVHGNVLYARMPDMFANAIFDSLQASDEIKGPRDLLILAEDAELIDEATVEALMSSNDRNSKQEALNGISIDTVVSFLQLLEPYQFEVFTVNDKGLLTQVPSDRDATSSEDFLEVKILVLPNGMACTLCTHDQLQDGAGAKVQDRLEFSSAPDEEPEAKDAFKHSPQVGRFMLDRYQARRVNDEPPKNNLEAEIEFLVHGSRTYSMDNFLIERIFEVDDVSYRHSERDQNIKRVMVYLMFNAVLMDRPMDDEMNSILESMPDELENEDYPNEFKTDPMYKVWIKLADNPHLLSYFVQEDQTYIECLRKYTYDDGLKGFENDPLYGEWCTMIKNQNYKGSYGANRDDIKMSKLKISPLLKEFVTNQIPTYTQSAIKSLHMLENREYAVTRDEDGKNGRIIPVDFQNSGVMEMNKKWGGGLQQMLEMKHNLSLSSISVVTNFMSHVELFSRYKENGGIYGLSGTLGLDSLSTQKVLLDLFECDVCSIPTHKCRKLYEKQPIIVRGGDEVWFAEIMKAIDEAVRHDQWEPGQGRAVLLLCEDIKTATELKEHVLSKENWKKSMVTLYANSNAEEVKSILSRHTFCPGEMVIATNLAGRGTNIKVSPEVEESGGLFCVMTFLPRNRRVELQAFGRTARKGLTGSVQCILNASSLPAHYQSLDLQSIRELRATEEHTRLNQLISSDVKEVQLKETLFKQHCKFLGEIYKQLGERDDKIIVIDSLNENWGQWLLMKKEQIEHLEKDALTEELSKAQSLWKPTIPQNQSDSIHLPVTNSYHLIKFGNRLLVSDDKVNAERACQYFQSSIEMEPRYAACAHYNHAYCTIILEKDGFKYMDQAIGDLEKADKCLGPYISELTSVLQCVSTVNKIRKELHGANDGANDHATQMQVRLQVIDFIKKKIKEAIEKLKGFRTDERHVDAKASGIFSLIPEADDLTHRELYSMWKLGMEVTFTVEARPKFCWDALIVFLIGVAQIIGGALLVLCTGGAFINFGMAVISEGIGDCIDGIQGMVTGEFSWVEWGVAKAVSIALALATSGIGNWLSKSKTIVKIGSKIATKMKSLKIIAKITEQTSKWGLAAGQNLKHLVQEVGKEISEQVVMKGISQAQGELFAKALEGIEKECRDNMLRDLTQAFSKGELGNTADLLFIQKLPDSYISDDRMLPKIRDDAVTFFKQVGDKAVSSLLSSPEAQQFMDEISLSLMGNLMEHSNLLSLAAGSVTMAVSIEAAKSKVKQFSERFIPCANEICSSYMDYLAEDGPNDGENQQPPNVKNLKCAVALKEELAESLGDSFSKAVTAILNNNGGSFVNKNLSGAFDQIGQNLFDKNAFRSDKAMEELKAGQSANYIRFVENTDSSHDDDDIIEQYVTRLRDVTTPGSLLELRILAEHFGVGITVCFEETGESIYNYQSSGANHIELICVPPSSDHPNGLYKLKNSSAQDCEASNSLFYAFACGRNPGLPPNELREQTLAARNKAAEIVGSQPDRWRGDVSRRLMVDQLKNESFLARMGSGN